MALSKMAHHIPNALTVLRILLVPLFLYLALKNRFHAATVVFALAGITDAVDGFIARAFNFRTELGAHLDPFADKLLLFTSYIVLTSKGFIPLWLTVPVILRDFLLLAGVIYLLGSGRKVLGRPSVFGKLTTCFQIATVFSALLFYHASGAFWFTALAGVTALLTVFTGIHYPIREFRSQFR